MEHIIALEDLKAFCTAALEHEGMESGDARRCAEALAETDAYGTHSHGTKNLHNYIKKFRAGGMDIHAALKVLTDGPAYALLDAQNGMGECASYRAMELAIEKARKSGVALVTVCDEHFLVAAGQARGKVPAVKGINRPGAYFWNLLQQKLPENDILRRTAADYHIPIEKAALALRRFAALLAAEGYLTIAG